MKYVYLFTLVISMLACNSDKKKNNYTKIDSEDPQVELAKAAKLNMENKCYLCHNPTSSEQNRIGPPMAAIKARYLKDASSKEHFIQAIWNFVEQPTKQKAKLKGAVKRFGVMPYQKYNQEEIEAIAAYIFSYNIEEPDWFKAHWKEKHGEKFSQKGKKLSNQAINDKDYTAIGMKYAKTTKAQLGKNLMGAIQNNGVLHALEFCNVQAMPITDSMAQVHQAQIKRVSDKNRNPLNAANSSELKHIKFFKSQIAEAKEPKPIIEENSSSINFYYPILTNDMCLKCHGKPNEDIAQKNYNKILKLYPNDKAIGYDINEVRGIWSIEFEKNEK
ncbi:c-type heme family protein [Psychroflexus salis]|uniref:Cytochrome c domain-containing protein n=1 Tax=Psychroflexus salis TaxID=1526574 RepID=A0A916ZP08_9FLAO|nr:DUF3365 domain-containing protein [Psychroflexus salis]GGE07246.1 hypothetical protein GCM10010831_05940 [Psychroflexus salis]